MKEIAHIIPIHTSLTIIRYPYQNANEAEESMLDLWQKYKEMGLIKINLWDF